VIHEPVLEISCGQKQCAHTHRQTDTRRWPQDLAAYGAQVIKQRQAEESRNRHLHEGNALMWWLEFRDGCIIDLNLAT